MFLFAMRLAIEIKIKSNPYLRSRPPGSLLKLILTKKVICWMAGLFYINYRAMSSCTEIAGMLLLQEEILDGISFPAHIALIKFGYRTFKPFPRNTAYLIFWMTSQQTASVCFQFPYCLPRGNNTSLPNPCSTLWNNVLRGGWVAWFPPHMLRTYAGKQDHKGE